MLTGTKQPISVLSGAVAGCDRFLLTVALLMTSSHSEGAPGSSIKITSEDYIGNDTWVTLL